MFGGVLKIRISNNKFSVKINKNERMKP